MSLTSANWAGIKKDMKALAAKMFPDNRNLIGGNHERLNRYGCWCYFDDLVGNGKSNPINLVDAECKILHGGYECIVADHAARGEECTPWTQAFVSGVSSTKLDQGVVAACRLDCPSHSAHASSSPRHSHLQT